jgi:hypothetical protein
VKYILAFLCRVVYLIILLPMVAMWLAWLFTTPVWWLLFGNGFVDGPYRELDPFGLLANLSEMCEAQYHSRHAHHQRHVCREHDIRPGD